MPENKTLPNNKTDNDGVILNDYVCGCGNNTYNIMRESPREIDEPYNLCLICVHCATLHIIQ